MENDQGCGWILFNSNYRNFHHIICNINADVVTSVNTAIYTDNVAGNAINEIYSFSSNESKFLIMNVSVKNKGNIKVTINPNDFSLLTHNVDSNSQIFFGNTSISSVEVGAGENKSMLLAFTLESSARPDKLKYNSFWDPGSEGATTNIGNIANTTPFDGHYSFYIEKGEFSWSGGSKSVETTFNVSYNHLNQPFIMESLDIIKFSNISSTDFPNINTSTTYNRSIKQTVDIKHL